MSGTLPLTAFSDALSGIVDRVAARVVGVQRGARHGVSGIIWQDSVVVTAELAVRRDDALQVTLPGNTPAPATLVGRDPSTDIAVLRTGGVSAQPADPAADPRAGALALVVARRDGASTARLGIVSESGDAWRSLRGGRIDRLIRLDIRLDPAGEGGAVCDAAGRLIGMPVFGPRGRVLVIPTATIARVVPQILAGGSIPRGYLGLGLHPVPNGAIVVSIDPDGPGAAAGVLLGDVITTWNGEALAGLRDLIGRLGPESADAAVELGLVRAGSTAKVTLHVGKRQVR